MARLTHRHKQPFTLTFTPTDNLESHISPVFPVLVEELFIVLMLFSLLKYFEEKFRQF